MNEFIENIIFENEKDKGFKNSYEFYKLLLSKYKIGKKIPDLYKRIINYQIERYGQSLDYVDKSFTYNEIKRINQNANARRSYRLNYRLRRKYNERKEN